MGINKIQYGNTTLIDLTSDTVTAEQLMQGYTAHDRTGALITGTATGGGSGGNVWQDAQGYVHLDDEGTAPITVESLSVTQNGTYTAPTGKAYSPVTVNVSGGGGNSSYTLIDSFEVTASTTSTTAETVYTYTNDILWDASSMLYVRIRDKAGKRANYFYGSDNFFLKDDNRSASQLVAQGGRAIIRYTSSNRATVYFAGTTTGYGVYANRIEPSLTSYELTISKRYNSNYSLTVDGTFTVEIYSLKWPDDISPFV